MADRRGESRIILKSIFLAEAFTRPKVMYRLAKLGFSQSYTYFTWRNTKRELTDYFTELTRNRSARIFSPEPWPNTPDILHEYLQFGGRPAFMARLVLAATLERQLWHLWSGFRAVRGAAARTGQRGISRFGKISDATLGSDSSRKP